MGSSYPAGQGYAIDPELSNVSEISGDFLRQRRNDPKHCIWFGVSSIHWRSSLLNWSVFGN